MMTLDKYTQLPERIKEVLQRYLPPDLIEEYRGEVEPVKLVLYLEYARVKLLSRTLSRLKGLELKEVGLVPEQTYVEAINSVNEIIEKLYEELDKIVPGLVETRKQLES